MKEWFSIPEGREGYYISYGLCNDGLYHWNKDENYAGYTAKELIEMGAE